VLLAAAWPSAGCWAILTWFHLSLQRKLDEAAAYAEQLAGCNLKLKLEVEHPHPLSQLTRALAQIHVNLRAAISDARAEVAGTGAATAEIARGSQDLSKRTDEQSGALQKTVASMQHIASTVARTATTAGDVARQSDATALAATEGGAAMGRVGTAINAVEHSSRQVAEIVQLIQGIAFQTNILALNAAVEAARAGDQGRGFAVVASEVRGLASRSANAAKQVRELIHTSVEQVADSTRQMGGANTAIGQTVAEVQRVGEMIRGITQAASDQAQDIAEINRAVTTLDQMTQANAALVQETAAAVGALHQRTETLQRTVQVFRL
jgi:aerotaxis receptor